jgi:hypothetical protein
VALLDAEYLIAIWPAEDGGFADSRDGDFN